MLSICIPHYNFKNPALFESLLLQCESVPIKFEILIADDASITANKSYLEAFTQPTFKIFFLKDNIGRSAIRNFLAKKAQYPNLLFLDADAEITTKDFIAKYIEHFGTKIISGGRIYSNQQPKLNYLLHYKYGSQVEQYANKQFQSNNFLVPNSVFPKLSFDESIKGYGYEDVIFGLDAKKHGLELIRVDNPVKHIQLKSNEVFILDTEHALQNLIKLIKSKKHIDLEQQIHISEFYGKLKRFRLTFLLSIQQDIVLKKTKELMILNTFFGATVLLALYKLYYYHSLQKH